VFACTDLNVATHPRRGYASCANSNKSLFFMILSTAAGLDLTTSTVRDLTGNDPEVYGDMLSPGRYGEELDRLVLSDDGAYAAVVKDCKANLGYFLSSQYGYHASFSSYYPYINTPVTSYNGWNNSADLMVVSTSGADMHSGGTSPHILFLGTGQQSSTLFGSMPSYAMQVGHFNGPGRRFSGLQFTPDNRRLIVHYAGGGEGSGTGQWTVSGYAYTTNLQPFNPSYMNYGAGDEISVMFNFRDQTTGGPVDFSSASNFKNNLQGLTGNSPIGQTTSPFGITSSQQMFWCTFRSEDGNFLYYISDQYDTNQSYATANRNFMVGFNITNAPINGHDPFEPFITHPNTIGFEQFDCNAWNYEFRFAASPRGIAVSGRDARGILCVIASDASAGAGSATDLEVYVMDTNNGTDLMVLTSAVTNNAATTAGTGSGGFAINHLYLSCEGNVLAGLISKTGTSSATSRAFLNSNNFLFVVVNIHAVLFSGATPIAFLVGDQDGNGNVLPASHGATVAFVGDGTGAGPQALIFSSGPASSSNSSWTTRTLKAVPLAAGAVPTVLDSTQMHYVVAQGNRKLDDIFNNAN
jgi:hypothetical protein